MKRTSKHLDHWLRECVKENIAHAEFHVVKKLCAVIGLVVKHDTHGQTADQMMVKLYVQADLEFKEKYILKTFDVTTGVGKAHVFTYVLYYNVGDDYLCTVSSRHLIVFVKLLR